MNQEYIIQEFNPQCFPPRFCDLDGTVCDSFAEACTLLHEFKRNGGYSAFDTREYRVAPIERRTFKDF